MKWLGIILMVIFAACLFYAEGDMTNYGSASGPTNQHVSPYYIQYSMEDMHTPDMVTAILADYRGYDTLGETTVIFTAGLICFMLLGDWRRNVK